MHTLARSQLFALFKSKAKLEVEGQRSLSASSSVAAAAAADRGRTVYLLLLSHTTSLNCTKTCTLNWQYFASVRFNLVRFGLFAVLLLFAELHAAAAKERANNKLQMRSRPPQTLP